MKSENFAWLIQLLEIPRVSYNCAFNILLWMSVECVSKCVSLPVGQGIYFGAVHRMMSVCIYDIYIYVYKYQWSLWCTFSLVGLTEFIAA